MNYSIRIQKNHAQALIMKERNIFNEKTRKLANSLWIRFYQNKI